jgi:hypothetical protein
VIHLRISRFRLRISKRVFRAFARLALIVAIAGGLYAVGVSVTPRDDDGTPLLLSPSLWATERYRAQAREWIVELAEIDRRLAALLSQDAEANLTELYRQSQEMQAVGETTSALERRITSAEPPVSMVGLRERAEKAARAYLEAAVLAARWLNAPSETGHREAMEALEQARSRREELEQSRWLPSSPRVSAPHGAHPRTWAASRKDGAWAVGMIRGAGKRLESASFEANSLKEGPIRTVGVIHEGCRVGGWGETRTVEVKHGGCETSVATAFGRNYATLADVYGPIKRFGEGGCHSSMNIWTWQATRGGGRSGRK